MARRSFLIAILIIVAISFAMMADVCSAQPPSSVATYIGAKECKMCHAEIYNGWKSTMHPYKFQPVSPDAVGQDGHFN